MLGRGIAEKLTYERQLVDQSYFILLEPVGACDGFENILIACDVGDDGCNYSCRQGKIRPPYPCVI